MNPTPPVLRRLFQIAALITTTGLAPAQANSACESAEFRAAAERLLAQVDARWQARDPAGMAALYHPQGQLRIQPGGVVADGQAGVARLFTQLFPTLSPEDDHLLSLLRVTPVGGLCALDTRAVVGSTKGAAAQRFQGFYLVDPTGAEPRILAVSAVRATP
ncbi:hypothetical protein [Inhella gelatinilytica]|uniref:SnoaL-like domain-containing protein n=1 Tax=Inhella gelatinilytica TaxID=2795030 RepID=A0A931IVI4_9BURK|nr:hypothetical protein [Inhella gelatinilytica]MBH9551428.1 hypothetical protein [Inhella gelatinilytica]